VVDGEDPVRHCTDVLAALDDINGLPPAEGRTLTVDDAPGSAALRGPALNGAPSALRPRKEAASRQQIPATLLARRV